MVCFAFVFCHVLTFVRYIGVIIYTFGPLERVRYDEDFQVISRFFPRHFSATLAGLKSILCYTEDFDI